MTFEEIAKYYNYPQVPLSEVDGKIIKYITDDIARRIEEWYYLNR